MSTFSLVLDGNLCFHRSRSPLLLLLVAVLPLLLVVTTFAAAISTNIRKQIHQKNECFINIKDKPGFDGWETVSASDVVVIGSDSLSGMGTTSAIGVASIGFSAVDSSSGTNS